MLQSEFVGIVSDPAMEFQLETKMLASVTIAQACLETGYGKSMPVDIESGKKSNNIFGVKWNGKGDYVISRTREVVNGVSIYINAKFQAYDNMYDSISGHGKLVGYASRYAPVRNATTAEEQCKQLYKCGYATDPQYAEKLISIIAQWNLKQYDKEALALKEKLEALQKQILEQSTSIRNLVDKVQTLENQHNLKDIPSWAIDATAKAVDAGLIVKPVMGSFDFFRLLTVMNRAKLFDKKV